MSEKIAFNRAGPLGQLSRYMAKYKGLIVFSILLLSGLGTWIGFSFKKKYAQERKEMVEALAEIQYLMEKKQYDEALEGKPGIYPGLKTLSKQTSRHKDLCNLVYFYMGKLYAERKNYQEALKCLKYIQMTDFFMQACVKRLEGDMHCEMANYDQALSCYLEAAKLNPNEFFSPNDWIKAAQVYEKQKKYDKAIACYQKIMDKYPTYRKHVYVEKQLARLMCLNNKS